MTQTKTEEPEGPPPWVREAMQHFWLGINILIENGHDNWKAVVLRILKDVDRRQKKKQKAN